MLLLVFVSVLYLQSEQPASVLRAFVQLTSAVAPIVMHRADAAPGVRPSTKRFQFASR